MLTDEQIDEQVHKWRFEYGFPLDMRIVDQAKAANRLQAENQKLRGELSRAISLINVLWPLQAAHYESECISCVEGQETGDICGQAQAIIEAEALKKALSSTSEGVGRNAVIEAAIAWYQNVQKRWETPEGAKGVTHYREQPDRSVEFDLHKAVEALKTNNVSSEREE